MLTSRGRRVGETGIYIPVLFLSTAVMTNFEEIIALVIFLPCLICVLAGICSMVSYRCACCCNSNNNSESSCNNSGLWHCLQGTRTDFQEGQHNYTRRTRGTSTLLNLSFEEEGSRLITEFDFRQSLHMECGVVALEPPPSYAAAMKTFNKQTGQQRELAEGQQREVVEGGGCRVSHNESTTMFITSARGEVSASGMMVSKGSPPPYREDTSSHAIQMNAISVVRTAPMAKDIDVSSV